ncbi:MAG: hypothetical protein V3T48_02135 [Vicinamibacterales bacterium]
MRSRLFKVVVVGVLAAFGAVSTGCYERVIRAEGIGSDRVDTYEPNSKAEPDVLDDIMWGEQPKKK